MNQWQRSYIPWEKQMLGGGMLPPQQFSMQMPLAEIRTVFPTYDAVQRAEQRADILPSATQMLQPQGPSVFDWIEASQRGNQRAAIQPQPPPQSSQPPPSSLLPPPSPPDPSIYIPVNMGFQQNPARPCEQCNGDCSNYLCYGCGGCPALPSENQRFMYPYQKLDSGKGFHQFNRSKRGITINMKSAKRGAKLTNPVKNMGI